MRFGHIVFLLESLAWIGGEGGGVAAFAPQPTYNGGSAARAAARVVSMTQRAATPDLSEFDYLLQETTISSSSVATPVASRRRIALSSPASSHRTTILASSFPAPTTMDEAAAVEEGATGSNVDPYADAFDAQMDKIQQYQEKATPPTLTSKLKQMDLQDVILTLIVPAIALFAAGKWGFQRVATRVQDQTDNILEHFCREMLFHDGKFKEMDLCMTEYQKKLRYLGPARRDTMLKRYLEQYAKKKTVSPQAISSLSYVLNAFRVSETQAAQLFVSLCREMGAEKIASAGKLLFLGTRILASSPASVQALEPIKTMIKSTYRDATVAETLVETSQHAMAEAAYRTAVQGGGKNQKQLTPGWQVLGLDQATAQRIWNEEAKEGFVSARETMYGKQTQKYDKHGNRLDKDGSYENPADAKKAAKSDNPNGDGGDAVSNVYECGECGFTLFIAQGRESKFFGDNFRCPECGAAKDKFSPRSDMDDDE